MSFMVFVTCLTIAFVAGFAVARKLTLRKVASSVIITKSQPVPSSATSPAAKRRRQGAIHRRKPIVTLVGENEMSYFREWLPKVFYWKRVVNYAL